MNRSRFLWLCIAAVVCVSAPGEIVFPMDAGVLNVRDFGAVGDGVTDDTAAIQAALDFEASGNRIVYIPDGDYVISDTLRWNDGASNTTGDDSKRTILQGESESGAVIRLKDAAAGYQDPNNRRAMVNTGTAPAQRFRNAIRNVTFDTGSNNAGSVGLQFIANNQGGIRDVTIRSGDGAGVTGLDMRYTDEVGPMLVKGLTVEGFDSGIETRFQTASQTFEGVTLRDQNVIGWRNEGQTVFARGLTTSGAVTAVENVRNAPSQLTLLDADMTYTGPTPGSVPAVFNDRNMYGRNLRSQGFSQVIEHDDKNRGNVPGVTGDVADEFLSHGDGRQLFDGPRRMLDLPVRETPTVAHSPQSTWANPASFGGVEGSTADQTAAIQAAIDSGARTVYLPNGRWQMDGDVVIRGNVERIIGTESRVHGPGRFVLADQAGGPDTVVVERLELTGGVDVVHDSSRTLVLSSILGGGYENTTDGTGDLFIEDVAFARPVTFENQSVWARQLNQETDTQALADPDAPAKITNRGGELWILGLKTELAGTIIHTSDGGSTELYGALLFANGDAKIDPAFVIDEATFTAAGLRQITFNSSPYDTLVSETFNGETRTLTGSFGNPGVYYGTAALAAIPEPTVGTVGALGVGGWMLRRRR